MILVFLINISCTHSVVPFQQYEDSTGVVDSAFFPLQDNTIRNLNRFHTFYPFLVLKSFADDHSIGMSEHFFIKNWENLENNPVHIIKTNISNQLKYQSLFGIFIMKNKIYVLASNNSLFILKSDGNLLHEIVLNVPEDYALSATSQLTVTKERIFCIIRKLDTPAFSAVFCDPTAIQLGIFDRAGNFIRAIPLFNQKELCGKKCLYRLHPFKYVSTESGNISILNIFQNTFITYSQDGLQLNTEHLPFFPLIKPEDLNMNSDTVWQNKEELFDLEDLPYKALSNAFLHDSLLYVITNTGRDNKTSQSIICYDLDKKEVIAQKLIDGEFIGFNKTSKSIISIREDKKSNNLFLILSSYF